ncbi:hypothetical protein SprV_0802627200 [Sparganum proliferum]
MFRIPGRTPTPLHQPTTSRPTPELGGHCAKVSRSSPNAGGRRRGPQRVVPTAEDEILAVLQSPGVVQYQQRWRLLASTLTCRGRRIVQMQVLRQHTDGYAFRYGHCRQKRCLRTGSIFFGSKLSLQTLLRICYKTASISSSAAEESQATMIGESNQHRRRRKTVSGSDEGTDRRCEMIVAVAC